MLEFIGALAATIVAIVLIGNFIYMPLMSIGFGGMRGNWPWLVGGIILSAATAIGWWYLVGTNIHIEFG